MVYLKSVEAYGFKSFADKTTVKFDKGVTAIVGPNGSGKSNITDAIKWVLGEQSAKSLRGSKMEDIIFSGAEDRKPLNYAEVTLILDNSEQMLNLDTSNVEVTRRLYRSGDSEYYINRNRTRLKDITELFLDSGLGRDAFSIISQGKVDEVLNAKPEDRRQLIEEAAGVLKYKKRKKETVEKLDDTMANLSRVHDIIFDLKDRVEPLKEEAAIAEEFIELSKEMKDADIQVTVHDITESSRTYEKIKKEIHEFEELKNFKNNKYVRLSDKITESKNAVRSYQKDIDELKSNLLIHAEQIERTKGEINVLREREHNSNASQSEIEKRIEKLKSLVQEKEKSKDQLSSQYSELDAVIKLKNKELKSLTLKKESLSEDIDALIENTRNDYYDKISEQTHIKNELTMIEKEIKRFKEEEERQRERFKDITQIHDDLKSEIKEKKELYSKQQHELEVKRTNYKQFAEKIQKASNDLKQNEEKLYQAYHFLESLKSRKSGIEAMQEEYQGYYQGVRKLLKDKDKLNGIHNAVLELIQIDPEYNDALEAASGAQLQNIVVENEHSAREAIQYLNNKKAGRATFLPMNIIKSRKLPENMLNTVQSIEGYRGILSDIVKTDPRYKHIIESIMGTTIVTETLKQANHAAKVINHKYRVVSLDGNIVNPGGSMTGGSRHKENQLLKSRETLNEINEKIRKFNLSISNLETNIKTDKETISELEFQQNKEREIGESLRDEVHHIKMELDELNAKLERLSREHRLFNVFKEEADRISNLEKNKLHLEKENQSIQALLIKLTDDIENYSNQAKNKKQSENELNEKIHTLQNEVSIMQERRLHLDHLIESNDSELSTFSNELSELQSDGKFDNIETIKSDIKKLCTKEKELLVLKDEVENKIQALQNKLHEENEVLEKDEHNAHELQRQITGLENGIGELKGKYSRLDVTLDNLMTHLNETYQLTFESAQELIFEHMYIDDLNEIDIENKRKRVKLTKKAIEELGNVNLNAIEQYKSVSERYEFLSGQEADLLKAKENLETIIKEMDETVSRQFMDTFEIVQKEFQEIFRKLFGGGIGMIQLTNDDILNAGIEIYIEPPGKKRQNLTLLSGGERALTAIVLLFSILKARSAPFVILDEVEAALDEANVTRFADYLNTLKQETQFIVITHRKGTMEKSDRLYGVTMQNSGITQLVSVNLSELDQHKIKELTQ